MSHRTSGDLIGKTEFVLTLCRNATDPAPQCPTSTTRRSASSCRSVTPVVTQQEASSSSVNDTWKRRMNAALVAKSSTSMSRTRHTSVVYVCEANETRYGIYSAGADRRIYLGSLGKGEDGALRHIQLWRQRSRYFLSLNQARSWKEFNQGY